ncbi:hypothetical protein CYLTODRAFT_420528 [Cylindrobasidium torrendii FP15055 ss-10]|uniref:DUF6593 domain-containing protein n=1 Tax=Cylindrobasidium torrendii FP15055 ss-10 TaxID=1314674 RepID=A0A0D7BHD4_9AGAR|nr:hypothetical protein CYLTODRAFT_420528 [Cylindrobasidium torrendii FP15055 ss-10]
MVNLYLSSGGCVIRSTYATSDGTVLYKAETPYRIGSRTTSILSLLPSDIPNNSTDGTAAGGPGRYAALAHIEWKGLSAPNTIRYGGQEHDAKVFLKKEGWSWRGRHRIFTAADGKQYQWIMGMYRPRLVTFDDKQETVALFHRRRLGLLTRNKGPPYLEVMPEGEDMLDLIVVTFIYIEKVRKDRERASRSSGGGG